jgi:hypothetical protein
MPACDVRCASSLPSCIRAPSTSWIDFTSRCVLSNSCRRHGGLRSPATSTSKELILKELGRIKWFLWHWNVVRADDTLSSLIDELDAVREEDREGSISSLRSDS